jgi:hypothetical protein
MVLAIPGGWGLFSQLQSVILHATNPKPSDCLPQCVHDQLDDIRWIANSLNAQPTCWAKIVDSSPAFIGTVDASGLGMGGTWISCTQAAPLLWRHRFDATISDRLVSTENLTYLRTTTMFAKKPSAPYLTIWQPSPVNAICISLPYLLHPPTRSMLPPTGQLPSGPTQCHGGRPIASLGFV